MLIEAAVLVSLILLLVVYGKWKQQYWTRRGVPQLNPKIALGDYQPLLTGSISMQEYFLNLYRKAQAKGGKHLGLYNVWSPEYMPIDLGVIKRILSKDFNHFSSHGVYCHKDDPLAENLFTMEGQAWKERRVSLTPTFTSGKMKMMYDILLEKTVPLVKVIDQAAEANKPVRIKDVMARFTTDIIASIAFGLDCNTLEEPQHKFRNIGREALKPKLLKFILETSFNPDLLVKLGYKSQTKNVRDYFTEIVKQTIEYRDTNNVQRKDFMQLVMQMRNNKTVSSDGDGLKVEGKSFLNDKDITNEAFLFYLAGFETSSGTMTFAFTELSQHPEMQEKLRQEVNQVVEKHGGKITYDGLLEMDYLDKIVKETLRKYPVLADLPRYCTMDYKVPDSDLVIEKGTRVHIPVMGIHHDPQYYSNPDEFNPENFSPENVAKRPDFSYMPFGEGPRMCIGMRFGLMQVKLGLASVVRNFRFSLDPTTRPPFDLAPASIVFTTKKDILIRVTRI